MGDLKDLRWHTCTPDDPWKPELGKRGLHPDAVEGKQRDGHLGGDLVDWHCPICGVSWTQELPQ